MLLILSSLPDSDSKSGFSNPWQSASDNAKLATLATPVHLLCDGRLGFRERKCV